ncbi:MAG TPA: alpha/beta hydrolase [Drouetiella sp.]
MTLKQTKKPNKLPTAMHPESRQSKFVGIVALSFLMLLPIFAPAAMAEPAQVPMNSVAYTRLAEAPLKVPVFFVTNRKITDGKNPEYTNERSEDLRFGARDITLEATKSQKVKYENETKPVDLSEDDFYNQLTNAQQLRQTKKVVLYVHGYDMNMDVSSRVAARLSGELKLPVIMYSWPSRRNPLTYSADENMAEWASFRLTSIMQDLSKRYGKENIILVGHSMGCRMLCWSLQQAKALGQDPGDKFDHIFLCSPDIDLEVFKKYSDLFVKCSNDTRIFASYRDYRLLLSKMLHGGIRLGMMNSAFKHKDQPVIDGIETVDYTDDDPTFFGHAIPFNLLFLAVQPRTQAQAASKAPPAGGVK